jgi:drug efflux transport system ATP-binding protein
MDTPGADAPALSLSGVTRSFLANGRTNTALDRIDLRIPAARVTGLIGPDGAGKTTLMRLAAGLLLPDSGAIHAIGIDVVADPLAAQCALGYMPQRFGLYEDLSVQENLDFYADLQGLPEAQRQERYEQLLHMTGLGPFTRRLAGRLSGGMKQKLGLACTLVNPPRLLLLDEPTVGVDPVSRRELWQIVYRLVREERMSVLLSTAYLDEAERCDEVVLLHKGTVLGQGVPAAFSAPMQGRTWRIATNGAGKRRLQQRIGQLPGVIDALIDGEAVRVVTAQPAAQPPSELQSASEGATVEAVAPRFEDAFVARLKSTREAGHAVESMPSRPHPRNGDDTVIEVRDVYRRFGDFVAVKGVSFSVRRGEIFGLLGANGAGKSTTFRMLCGLLPASAGTLNVAGHDLRHAAAKARGRLGYMAQRFSLYANLTVAENLRFFASTYGLDNNTRTERIRWALENFELTPYTNSNSGDLPLGFKQRLAFAAALMHEPDILFLDEPTSGVDPLARREFWERTNALAESGVTVLVTTHFMDEANYCDRLVIMAEGELLALGTPAEMKQRFRTPGNPHPTMEDAFIGLIEARMMRHEPAA